MADLSTLAFAAQRAQGGGEVAVYHLLQEIDDVFEAAKSGATPDEMKELARGRERARAQATQWVRGGGADVDGFVDSVHDSLARGGVRAWQDVARRGDADSMAHMRRVAGLRD